MCSDEPAIRPSYEQLWKAILLVLSETGENKSLLRARLRGVTILYHYKHVLVRDDGGSLNSDLEIGRFYLADILATLWLPSGGSISDKL